MCQVSTTLAGLSKEDFIRPNNSNHFCSLVLSGPTKKNGVSTNAIKLTKVRCIVGWR